MCFSLGIVENDHEGQKNPALRKETPGNPCHTFVTLFLETAVTRDYRKRFFFTTANQT